MTGSKSTIKRMPLPSDDPKQRRPDISLVKKTLDWEPTTSLEQGLAKTIDYFKSSLR
jgi:UDP-glucuronate decarboxylase